jgi:hypothetical protein
MVAMSVLHLVAATTTATGRGRGGIVVEQEHKDWTSARLIFGRLIAIDKGQSQLTLEYKDGKTDEWATETFTADWTDDEYDEALEDLGSDITLKVIDHQAIEYETGE